MNNCSFVVDSVFARLLPGLSARVRCLHAQKDALEEVGVEVLRTIRDTLGSASNDGMFFLVDEVDPGSDIEIAWRTEKEKEEQWERMTEVLDLTAILDSAEEEEEEEAEKKFG